MRCWLVSDLPRWFLIGGHSWVVDPAQIRQLVLPSRVPAPRYEADFDTSSSELLFVYSILNSRQLSVTTTTVIIAFIMDRSLDEILAERQVRDSVSI